MASASTPPANEPVKDLILVHTVQPKLIIIIMNKSQETTLFSRNFRYETKARNVMVDFKFDALYR